MNSAITARSATDMLSLIPYLLSFHVDDGVVVLVCQDRTVEVGLRFDYWMFDSPALVQTRLAHTAARFDSPRFFLAAYGADRGVAEDALALLEQVLDLDEVIDSVYTDGQRWWSRLCQKECCPPEGTPCDPTSAAAVSAVLAGSTPVNSRAEIERTVEGPTLLAQSQLLAEFSAATERVEPLDMDERGERVLELVRTGLADGVLAAGAACELALLVSDIPPRDEAWLEMGLASAKEHAALWRQVVAIAPESLAVPPLCLLAAAAWLSGNGVLMGCAINRAADLDPFYSMLHVLQDIHLQAAPPSLWREMVS